MTPRGPVVIDTDVFGASLIPGSDLAARDEPVILGRPVFISFQTAAELRDGTPAAHHLSCLVRSWALSLGR